MRGMVTMTDEKVKAFLVLCMYTPNGMEDAL